MSQQSDKECAQAEEVYAYALEVLPAAEVHAVEAHIASCPACTHEFAALRSVIDSFDAWPTDVLRPSTQLWERLAQRVAPEVSQQTAATVAPRWREPEWKEVAPGISCKLLATDTQRDRVSMLVRLAPGAEYPPHRHAGIEELHLLHGELWINDRKLYPGDYNHAEAGTSDAKVWSETGCTCVLITSTRDELN